jgi:hypothetical protein
LLATELRSITLSNGGWTLGNSGPPSRETMRIDPCSYLASAEITRGYIL